MTFRRKKRYLRELKYNSELKLSRKLQSIVSEFVHHSRIIMFETNMTHGATRYQLTSESSNLDFSGDVSEF